MEVSIIREMSLVVRCFLLFFLLIFSTEFVRGKHAAIGHATYLYLFFLDVLFGSKALLCVFVTRTTLGHEQIYIQRFCMRRIHTTRDSILTSLFFIKK